MKYFVHYGAIFDILNDVHIETGHSGVHKVQHEIKALWYTEEEKSFQREEELSSLRYYTLWTPEGRLILLTCARAASISYIELLGSSF